ncbi:MAG: cytochrome-c oxidase, cbb3-type subunit III [Castellaniella sp.]
MSDFFSGGWSIYIAAVAVAGIVFCLWLLYTQRSWLKIKTEIPDTGHVWDGDLTELNTPVPRWWTVMYLAMCAFAIIYLILYPGLGSFKGVLGYTTAKSVLADQQAMQKRVEPVYARYREMDIPAIAADADARLIGQRLFLNNCAQCHGSDARGASSFPNLADSHWMYGGEPEQIQTSITEGRHGIMPPWGATVSAAEAGDIAQYVRSLSGLAADPLRAVRGKRGFEATCVACHGADGKGNIAVGAPDLTANVWLYGSSEATIVQTILNGRDNQMPAQKDVLSEDQIRLLTAWVWGLSRQGTGAAH